jgi:hypothetical protein
VSLVFTVRTTLAVNEESKEALEGRRRYFKESVIKSLGGVE